MASSITKMSIPASVIDIANCYKPTFLVGGQALKPSIGFSKVHGITKLQFFSSRRPIIKCAVSNADHYNYKRFTTEPQFDPFWLSTIKSCRSLVLFLFEQPSQLKYIEWPSFQSTLKIATLTVVIVAVLLVLLSSTDAALSFILALMLKRRG